jgi:hypothetical protein
MELGELALKTCVGCALALLPTIALGEGRVTAEKSCVVKVEGENFELGNRLYVYRSVKGRDRNLAIIEIRKRIDSNTSIGKVIKGPRLCFDFKGASVRPVVAAEAASKGTAPGRVGTRGEAFASLGAIFLAQEGLAYPGTLLDSSASRLKSYGVRAGVDVYPLTYFKKNLLSDIVGVGFRLGYASVYPDSEVVDAGSGNKAGTLATKLSDIQIDIIARLLWLKESASTELRPTLYLTDSVTHTFTGEKSNAAESLTNVSFSGMGIGVGQKFFLGDALRFNLGLVYGLQLKGEGGSPLDGPTVPITTPSGYIINIGGQIPVKKLLVGGEVLYSTFSGSVQAQNKSKKVSNYVLTDSRLGFFLNVALTL